MKTQFICTIAATVVAFLAIVTLRTAAAAESSTPQGFQEIKFTYRGANKRFFWSTEKLLWFEAQLRCIEVGTRLVSVKTVEAQNAMQFAMDTYGITGENWISLHRSDASDTWKWGDGSSLTYTNWYHPSEANEFGGAIMFGTNFLPSVIGTWALHADKTTTCRFFCE